MQETLGTSQASFIICPSDSRHEIYLSPSIALQTSTVLASSYEGLPHESAPVGRAVDLYSSYILLGVILFAAKSWATQAKGCLAACRAQQRSLTSVSCRTSRGMCHWLRSSLHNTLC